MSVLNVGMESFIKNYRMGNPNGMGHSQSGFMTPDENGGYKKAFLLLSELTHMNAKKNPEIGSLAERVLVAIDQEKLINQDVHNIKGKVTSNTDLIIEKIINEQPKL